MPLGPLQRGGGQADQRKSFQHPQTRSPAPLPRGKALVRRPVPALSPGRRGSLPRLTSLPGTARRPPAFPPEQANPASRGAHQRSPPYSSPRPPSPEEGNPPHATPRHATTKRAPPRPGRGKPACGPGPALHPSPRGGGRDGGAFLPQVLAGGAAPTPPEEPCQPPRAAGGRERGHRGGGPGAGERGGAAPATHTRPASTRRPVPVPAPAVPAGGSPSIAAAVM